MQMNISLDSQKIIENHWGDLAGCPLFHLVHGYGVIESYSNEIFTIIIDDANEVSRCSRIKIHLFELHKGIETWQVNIEQVDKTQRCLENDLFECVNLIQKHLRMTTVLSLGDRFDYY